MTDTELRELDAQIAAKLFGWRWWSYEGHGGKRKRMFSHDNDFDSNREQWDHVGLREATDADMNLPIRRHAYECVCPPYSSSWDAMRLVMEEMQRRGWSYELKARLRCRPEAIFSTDSNTESSVGTTLPEAVALAALRALEESDGC